LNQPLIAFRADGRHAGALGKSFSLMSVSNSRVRVLAVKKAEESDEVVVRLVELDGRSAPDVRLRFAAPVSSAREVTGQEQPLGAATISKGELLTDFGPYQLRTFALKLAPARVKLSAPRSQPVEMPYDVHAATNHLTKARALVNVSGVPFGFDDAWHSLPAEMLPQEISFAGVRFRLAPGDAANALAARGQTLKLPARNFKRLYILAASVGGDRRATFRVGDQPYDVNVQDWGGFVGQWDARQWRAGERQVPPGASPETAARIRSPYYRNDPYAEMTGINPGFIKPAPLAWFASHHHRADGLSEAYAYSYLFAYTLDIPAGAKTLTLPDDDKVRVLAVTVSDESDAVRPAQPLFDWLQSGQYRPR
jgi:alpha-mannosidase